jgi:hypothetical protein
MASWKPAGLAILVLSCSGSEPANRDAAGAAIARLGSRTIDAAEIVATSRIRRESDRDALLRAAVGNVLAAEEAKSRGLADDPATQARIALIRARARIEEDSLLAQALYEAERAALAPTDAELLAHYEQTKHRYLVRKLVLRRVAYPSRDEAEAADRALGSEGRLDAASAETMPATEIQRLPASVLPEATYLKQPGDRVVAGKPEEGFSLVELVDDVVAEPRPFEDVRREVERDLRIQQALARVEGLVESRRAKAELEVDEEMLRDDATFAELERAAQAGASSTSRATVPAR